MNPFQLLLIPLLSLGPAASPPLLPAYAHNDYENRRPLHDAIRLGFRGVEADCWLVEGRLLVGHDRGDLRRGRTLERMYLEPLRDRIRVRGAVHPGEAEPFLLHVELKGGDADRAYETLHRLLSRYESMLTVVRGGTVEPGPVRVVLVGGHPPVEELRRRPVRFAGVQLHARDPLPGGRALPAHLVPLISAEYGETLGWNGRGEVPDRFRDRLAGLRALRDAVPGRRLRVYEVPFHARVYRALLEGGVDLIGTKDLERTRAVLTGRTRRLP